jgi:hypothetical protein
MRSFRCHHVTARWSCFGHYLLTSILWLLAAAALADGFDPFREESWSTITVTSGADPFEKPAANPAAPVPPSAPVAAATSTPVDAALYQLPQPEPLPTPLPTPTSPANVVGPPPVGCGAPNERPLGELTINIQVPQGDLPTDHAAACWQQLNATSGPLAGIRVWAQITYAWDATCMAHRPLYFEEINLERYGYGCCDCLQSAASAAHFFATVPALPYCMAAECPGECQYTLRHDRPGSCPPWRCHYPRAKPIAGLSEAGVLTGLIFLIP